MFEDLKPHLIELRLRLGLSVLAVLIAFGICALFWSQIYDIILAPAKQIIPDLRPMTTGTVEGLIIAIKVSLFVGFLIALPVIFWQLWLFIAPGLYEHEKKYVIPFVLFATIMFLSGASFCYIVVLPLGLDFLLNFGSDTFNLMLKADEYVAFFTKIIIAFGIAFEMPVLTFFLAKIGFITDKTLKDKFQYAIVLIFLLAALLTPPDVISQFLMAGPLIVLYGFSVLIAKVVNPAPKEEDDEEVDGEEEEEGEKWKVN